MARRLIVPGVTALEVWDLVVGDTTLFAAARRRDFPALLASALRSLAAGTARRASGLPIGPPGLQFEEVVVGGGGWDAIATGRRPCAFGTVAGGRFVGAAGGLALLDGPGLVVDVGQTAVKVAWPGGRLLVERDLRVLPVQSRSTDPAHRSALVEFIGGAIRRALALAPVPRRVVLALPAALRRDGTPEGSSYPGMAGDVTLVADVLAFAALADTDTLVLNDAELAALSARLQARRRALVLTIGFGVGAALLDVATAAR